MEEKQLCLQVGDKVRLNCNLRSNFMVSVWNNIPDDKIFLDCTQGSVGTVISPAEYRKYWQQQYRPDSKLSLEEFEKLHAFPAKLSMDDHISYPILLEKIVPPIELGPNFITYTYVKVGEVIIVYAHQLEKLREDYEIEDDAMSESQ